ncbi:hypothetical protein E2C01_090998 [Portunus trituberculatus]|uniref:Uncharacterized protein n=1 Tax=Portunus trituberculatus TaxID=210409 RepID=A0A5B7JI18_PORTR|nr:hypothetical protein [Portunus trituberculatus]
MPAYCGPE